MTIGLYDIDLYHGLGFSLSLPLMKIYNKLYEDGHQVIMMNKLENTGRYNQIFYFKDNPKLQVPASLVIDPEKATYLGYGFYKESGLTKPEFINSPPVFTPYEFVSDKLRSKSKFNKIKRSSIIDWRENDLSGYRSGSTTTYVNDRDFLEEDDWEEVFSEITNNIAFVHSVRSSDKQKLYKFLKYNYSDATIVLPPVFDIDELKEVVTYKGVSFGVSAMSDEVLFLFLFLCKIAGIRPTLADINTDTQMRKDLVSWSNAGPISFKEFKGLNWNDTDYYKFRYRTLLRQDPTKMTYDDFKEDYCVK